MADTVTRETPALLRESTSTDADPELKLALVLLSGPHAGRTFSVTDAVTLGRGPECTIHIDALDISRQHARIERLQSGKMQLRDLDSRNGTFVNGLRVNERPLELGDRITLGGNTILLFTQRDRLEEQILHQQRMEAIGRLAGGIAHDFNNLLGAVLGNSSVLLRNRPDTPIGNPDVQEMLADIRTAAQRACELTQQLLLFARRDSQEHRSIDLSKLVAEVVRMCRRTFEANIRVDTSISPNISVLGDSAQLHQVLMNLFINARDAMPSGGVLDVRLSSVPTGRSRTGNTPWALITVSDTGVGMDEATRQRVFEPFFTTKLTGQGTGLGLATVYGIISSHGGEIAVKSEVGRGSTFEVYLPQREREVRTSIPTPAGLYIGAEPKGTVLVVDDEDLYLRSSARILEEYGHQVLVARNGSEALEIFQRERDRIRLVLLDVMMPQMSGPETCRAIRRLDSGVKVLLVSGYRPPEMESVIQSGADGFLGKPFDIAALERATQAVLAK